MLLKRNVLTVIYSFVFMLLLGIGFIEVMFLAISSSSDRNVIACIIIIGIIIYLIVAFLLKEKNKVQFIQTEKKLFQISEAVFVLSLLVLAFILNMDADMGNNLMGLLLLAFIYGCARLLGGRLCGIMAASVGFFLFLYLSSANYESDHTMDILCILVPYFVFLFITKKIAVIYIEQSFLIVVSYLMLAVVFSLAVILEPLVLLLAAGCILSLLFGKPKEKGSLLTSGLFSAFILLAATVAILVGVYFFMPEVKANLSLDLDIKIKQMGTSYMDIMSYLLKKYLRTSDFLYDVSQTGIFPSILFFFSSLSGFYAIRKRSSAIGPLCFAYIGILVYHLLFLGNADEFYYMFYFLPIFSSYGIYNTLLPENAAEAVEKQAQTEEKEPEQELLSVSEPESLSESQPQPANKSLPEQKTEPFIKAEPERITNEEMVPDPMLQKEKKEKKKTKTKRNSVDPAVPEPTIPDTANMAATEIPEWTVSENFQKAAKEPVKQIKAPETGLPHEGEPILGAVQLSEAEQLPEIEQPVQMELFSETGLSSEPEEQASKIQLSSNNEISTGGELSFEEKEFIPESLEILSPEITAPEDTLDISLTETTADLSIPEVTDTDEDLMLLDEPELLPEDEPSLLSEDSLTSDNNIADESNTLEQFADQDNDADAQLNTLLNRLDISDNIRRMNESAREDIADIIERDVTENELHEAKPATELDFEPQQPLPKYVKPEFDFEIEPISQPLQDVEGSISEYDKVPTINDLEKKWRDVSETPKEELTMNISGEKVSGEIISEPQYPFAYDLEDIEDMAPDPGTESGGGKKPQVHSEEIVRENGMNKRSYHKLTIG